MSTYRSSKQPTLEARASRRRSLDVARRVLETEASALSKLAANLDEDALSQALTALLDCRGRIVCTGMGKSGVIARKLAGTLASTGSPAFFLHPAEAGHGDLGMIVDGDVVVALSHSGETAELVALLPAMRRLGVVLIVMVGEPASTLGAEAEVVLHVDIDEEACPLGLAPTVSTTAALALGDALAMALLEERGFSAEEFASLHPRGALGRRLLRVRTVMHTGGQLPRIREDAPLAAVVEEMTDKSLGLTVVEAADGTVAGVITDGDLRRFLQRGPERHEQVRAAELMTRGPVLVSAEALATEALRLLEESRITALIVGDADGKAIGVVHLHDLWRTQMI